MSSSSATPSVSSTPAPAVGATVPTGPNLTTPDATVPVVSASSSGSSAVGIGFMIFYVLIMLVSMAGAAKLSYDKFHSVGWAILDFFFSTYYYIYYAFFVSKSSSTPGVHPLAGGKSWRP